MDAATVVNACACAEGSVGALQSTYVHAFGHCGGHCNTKRTHFFEGAVMAVPLVCRKSHKGMHAWIACTLRSPTRIVARHRCFTVFICFAYMI